MPTYADPFKKVLKRGDTYHEAAIVDKVGFDFTGSTAQAQLKSDYDAHLYASWAWDNVAGTVTYASDPGTPVATDPLVVQNSGERLYIPLKIPHTLSRELPITEANKPLRIDIEVTLPDGSRKTWTEIEFKILPDATPTTD